MRVHVFFPTRRPLIRPKRRPPSADVFFFLFERSASTNVVHASGRCSLASSAAQDLKLPNVHFRAVLVVLRCSSFRRRATKLTSVVAYHAAPELVLPHGLTNASKYPGNTVIPRGVGSVGMNHIRARKEISIIFCLPVRNLAALFSIADRRDSSCSSQSSRPCRRASGYLPPYRYLPSVGIVPLPTRSHHEN